MQSPNDTLAHVTIYDPVKAHEYYMRTRKLKGRKPRSSSRPTRGSNPRSQSYVVKTPAGKTVNLTRTELDQQRAYAAKRVSEIKKNLAVLGTKLRKMRSDARKKASQSKREADKKPTVAEKSKAARESEKYRKEHKQELKTKAKKEIKKESANKDPVAELETKITEIKGRLAAAVAKQRALTAATKA